MHDQTILIASESGSTRESLRSSLSKIGMKVLTVMSWRQMQDILQTEKFFLSIIDEKLTDMDGVMFAQELGKNAKNKPRYTFMLEDVDNAIDYEKCPGLNVSVIIQKPMVLARLDALVRLAVELPDNPFHNDVLPGSAKTERKVAMAFLKSPETYKVLKASLKSYDTFLVPSYNTKNQVPAWQLMKPELTFVERDLGTVKGMDLVKTLRVASSTAELAMLAPDMDMNFIKEAAQNSVRNCLVLPISTESATKCFGKYFAPYKAQVRKAPKQPEAAAAPAVTTPKVKQKALFVDAPGEMSKKIYAYLEELELEVLSANDERSAMNLWQSKKPQIVVSEFKLSTGNGLNLLRSIRSTDQAMPFIMTSSDDQWSSVEDATQLGCAGWLQKPFEKDELQMLVRKILKLPDRSKVNIVNVKR